MNNRRKRAVLNVPLDFVKLGLRLPDGVFIDFAEQDVNARFGAYLTLVLSGDELPEECLTDGAPVRVQLQYQDKGAQQYGYLEPINPRTHQEPRVP
jgi:hypothetical protein